MNTIFHGSDFERLPELKEKFEVNGFNAPPEALRDEAIYSGEVWKPDQ